MTRSCATHGSSAIADLLQALNTGHAGTLPTIHANSAQQALAPVLLVRGAKRDRIAVSGSPVPDRGRDPFWCWQLGRHEGRRLVRELIRIGRYDVDHELYERVELFASGECRPHDIGGQA